MVGCEQYNLNKKSKLNSSTTETSINDSGITVEGQGNMDGDREFNELTATASNSIAEIYIICVLD